MHPFVYLLKAKQSLATLTKDVPKRHSLAMPTETVVNGNNQEWVMQADLPLTAAIRQSQQTLYVHTGHPTDRQGRRTRTATSRFCRPRASACRCEPASHTFTPVVRSERADRWPLMMLSVAPFHALHVAVTVSILFGLYTFHLSLPHTNVSSVFDKWWQLRISWVIRSVSVW